MAFDEPTTISEVRLVVFQNPPSDAIHVLEIRIDGEWSEATTFRGFTTTLDVLEWKPGAPLEGVEAFRVTTLENSSWPEWFEFEINTGNS